MTGDAACYAYVLLRAAHSFIRIGPKRERPRFLVYLASCAVPPAMWIGFFTDMVHTASVLAQVRRPMRLRPLRR